MKILHTSDWHLGHLLYGMERLTEQRDFLRQIVEIVHREQPDAMVVCGDIFHTATPSNAVLRMYTDSLLAIAEACPTMKIVVTAGNHDSSSKLEIDRNLWLRNNVSVVGTFEYADGQFTPEKHIIPVADKDGRPTGYILAVPYSHPYNFPVWNEGVARHERQDTFFRELLEYMRLRNAEGLPVVLTAHLTATGTDTTGHDMPIGTIEQTNISAWGDDYDYLALGHIHLAQTLRHTLGKARYSGSPIPVSFDENYPHSVSMVEVLPHEEPKVRTIEINNAKPLWTIPEEPAAWDEVLEVLKHTIDDDTEAYIRLNVLITDHLPVDANEQASHLLKDKRATFCTIKTTYKHEGTSNEQRTRYSLEEIRSKHPLEIARCFYVEKYGVEMPEDLTECMRMAIQAVEEEGRL